MHAFTYYRPSVQGDHVRIYDCSADASCPPNSARLLGEFSMNTTLSSNNSRFVITAAANQDSFLRVTFSAQPRSRARVGGFRASWSSCPLNTYWSKHCINPDIPRDSVAGVSECRSESPFEAKSDQSRIHLGACFRLFRYLSVASTHSAASPSWLVG